MANWHQVWARSGFDRTKVRRNKKTAPQRKQLFGTRKHRPCNYCGRSLTFETATVDHLIPLSRGGYEKLSNLVLACQDCNTRKGSMTADEFHATL